MIPYMHGTMHTCGTCMVSYMWNTHVIAKHRTHVGTHVQLTCIIHQHKNMSNSVHSALITSRINYQGNTLMAHAYKEYFNGT